MHDIKVDLMDIKSKLKVDLMDIKSKLSGPCLI